MSSTPRRLRLPEGVLDGVDRVEIEGGPLHHLRVLRARPGDAVRLFDGAGVEVDAEIEQVGPRSATARVLRRVEASTEAPLRCCLVQAVPVRLQRMDAVMRQATELGVARILPLLSERGRPLSPSVERRLARWRRIAAAAAEQSHRSEVPEIDPLVDLDGLAGVELPAPLLLLDPAAGLGSLARLMDRDPPPAASLLVGPEGGWSGDEIERLVGELGALRVGLGPRVLRADTAGPVAVAVLMHRWGDLG